MAKKKTASPSSSPPETNTQTTGGAEQEADHSPRVQKAAETVRRAEAELEKAKQLYQQVRQQAADQLKEVRQKTVGDLIDGTLKLVKRHPGPGVLIAALIGFFLGRLFRR